VTKLVVIQDSFVQPDLCGPCGGKCCRNMPGAAMPSDFGTTPDEIRARLIERLRTGRWAIDWWEGDPRPDQDEVSRGYFVRPATKDSLGELLDPSWGGDCTFRGEGGCDIFDERPSGCRGLKPAQDSKGCEDVHSGKRDCAIAWVPYRLLIEQVIAELGVRR
jgi:Fe-S-cluster containining protein